MKPNDHHAALEALAVTYGRSPADVLELFMERASIREMEGGMSRTDAERAAVFDVENWFHNGGVHAH
jgi:hypothetical protein